MTSAFAADLQTQGKRLHARNRKRKHDIPLENATESPSETSSENPLGK